MRCPDCSTEVSPLREYCPGCGASVDRMLRDREAASGPARRSPEELARNRKTVLWIGGGVLFLAVAMGNLHPFGRHVRVVTPPEVVRIVEHRAGPREPVQIGAAELFEAYHTDSDAADRRFGDREMVVSGQFVRTVPDGYGSIDMRLKTNHPDTPLGIDLDSHSVDAATRLKAGETVTVSCRRVAGSGDDPWLQDCMLQPAAAAEAAPAASAKPEPPARPEPPGSPE